PRSGRHRTILPFVAGRLSVTGRIPARSAEDARARSTRARHLLAGVRAARELAIAQAAGLLLLEILHEKGLPLARPALAQAFASDAHLAKLWRKHATNFFG